MKQFTDLRRQVFYPGKTIFREGDEGLVAYIIEKGRVEISRYSKEADKKVVLGVLGTSAIFGEMALIDGQPRMASATALEETRCCMIRKDLFDEKFKRSDPFIQGILRLFAQNIRSLTPLDSPES